VRDNICILFLIKY